MRSPPHAPYRTGAPGFTPALKPIEPDQWLQPDTEAHVLPWKRDLLNDPQRVYREVAGGTPAATEAARVVGAALQTSCATLQDAAALVSDDLVVMERKGKDWLCTALSLTAPTFFSIDDAFGRDLTALHGPVPDGAKLARRIGRVFEGLQPGTVLERFNWTLQCGSDRHAPDGAPLRERAGRLRHSDAEATLHLRVERQTIAKLPKTGAVLFTIRVCLDPLTAIPIEDRALLASAWRGLHSEGRAYKHWDAMERAVESVFEVWGV